MVHLAISKAGTERNSGFRAGRNRDEVRNAVRAMSGSANGMSASSSISRLFFACGMFRHVGETVNVHREWNDECEV